MANLTETPQWEAGIYRIETNDPVIGGENGISNAAAKQLGNRTAWLKAQVEALLADIAAIEGAYATTASLAAHTGNTANPHAVTKAQVGLGNVDNTADANKPVSTAQQAALDLKAPLASPALTGTPTAPNPATGTRSTQVATMQKFADEFALSAAVSGYQKLPSGLIIQWGGVTGVVGADVTTSYPIAFPNAVLHVFVTGDYTPGSGALAYYNASTQGSTLNFINRASSAVGARYFAIGH